MKNDKTKKVIGLSLAGLAVLGLGGFGGAVLFPKEVASEPVIKYVNQTEIKEVPVNVEVIKEVPVEVIKEVLVDNGNLKLVLDHIYDDDLDDDEVDEIVDRIVFINEVKSLAVEEVKDRGVRELDKELVFNSTVKLDDSDIERFKVLDEYSDVVVDSSSIDFDNKDATATVTVRFEQDDVKYTADFEVTFEDNEVDDISIVKNSIKVR